MNINEFLKEHKLYAGDLNPDVISDGIMDSMRSGLIGQPIDLPMIPTYLTMDGVIESGQRVIVIDAGGTNFRCGLASFNGRECVVTDQVTCKMPGTKEPCSWEDFIEFVTQNILPFADKSDYIGFCFSYSAKIMPDFDARVDCIDKEVCILGCEGKFLGTELTESLKKHGFPGKKCFVLNDTVAALFGSACSIDRSLYSDFIGLICGTGTNTCSIHNGKIYNQECGMYQGIPSGDFDIELDRLSLQPGEKLMEKKCSGVYIGKIARLALNREDTISGYDVTYMCDNGTDFEKAVCLAIIERSALCVASDLIAIMKFNDSGHDKPVCVCAEGSLIEKNAYYLPLLRSYISKYAPERKVEILLNSNTTLPGCAAAVLLNKN